jgi:hypothetical protein
MVSWWAGLRPIPGMEAGRDGKVGRQFRGNVSKSTWLRIVKDPGGISETFFHFTHMKKRFVWMGKKYLTYGKTKFGKNSSFDEKC